jgi:hypothetical protein
MAYSKSLNVQVVSGEGGSLDAGSKTYSGGSNPRLSEVIPAASTDLLLAFAMALGGLKLLVITATCAMTVKTNNSGAPADTLPLIANVPYIWRVDGYDTNLITTAITALYVTTAEGVTGTLSIEAIADATP